MMAIVCTVYLRSDQRGQQPRPSHQGKIGITRFGTHGVGRRLLSISNAILRLPMRCDVMKKNANLALLRLPYKEQGEETVPHLPSHNLHHPSQATAPILHSLHSLPHHPNGPNQSPASLHHRHHHHQLARRRVHLYFDVRVHRLSWHLR